MQPLTPLTSAELLANVQTIVWRLEIWDGATWTDVTRMDSLKADVLAGWTYRKEINISGENIDETLTNFPICVVFSNDDDINFGCLPSGYDIRFTAEDGATLLKYERESFIAKSESWPDIGAYEYKTAATSACGVFWVKIPVLTSAGAKIYIYWGNPNAADGSDPTAVWDSSFNAVYHMADATTSTILDSTANNYDGTKRAANEPVVGKTFLANGQTYDGTDDYVSIGAAANCRVDSKTVSFWARPHAQPAETKPIFGNQAANYYVGFSTAGGLITSHTTSAPVQQLSYFAAGDVLYNTWQHFAFTFYVSGSNVIINAFINGVKFNPATYTSGYGPITANDFIIGAFSSSALFYNGDLDELRMMSGAKSDAWIKFEYYNMAAARRSQFIPDMGAYEYQATDEYSYLTFGEREFLPQNYLKSMSCQVAGAGASTEPLAGSWSATLDNSGGIFNPYHPTSIYSTLIQLGRKVRLSWGVLVDGIETYWQRITGYVDTPRFDLDKQTVAISGTDYMKTLADTKLYSPYTAWGTSETFTSVATGGSGVELYDEADACEIGAGEANNTTNWAEGGSGGSTESVASTLSSFALQFSRADDGPTEQYTHNANIVAMTAGQVYIIGFWGRITHGSNYARFIAYETIGGSPVLMNEKSINGSSWRFYQFTATPTTSSNLQLRISTGGKYAVADDVVQVDNISVKTYDPDTWERYDLDSACNGVHYVTMDGVPVWHGDEDGSGGWHYEDNEGVKSMFFSKDMTILAGLPVVVYYYTDTAMENVVADLLVAGGLCGTRALALAAMSYTATGITLERCRFEPGTTALDAMRMLCERANYRFWFGYDGTPCFKPAPVVKTPADFTFTSIGHFGGMTIYQDINEVRNHIIITGEERAIEPSVNSITPSNWLGDAKDAASIAAYQEKTHQLDNYLFTDQSSVDAMCLALLDYYKNPKDYADFSIPFCPIPLEIGDTVEILVPVTQTVSVSKSAIVRSINLQDGQASYVCDLYASQNTLLSMNAAVLLYTSSNIVFATGGDTALTMFSAALSSAASTISLAGTLAMNSAAFTYASSTPTLGTNVTLAMNNAAFALASAGPTLACSITYTYTPDENGATVYVPTGYTVAQIACWGPGGRGGGEGEGAHGGGAGGGAYAYKSQVVTGGGRFDVFIGEGSSGASTYAAYNYSNVVLAVCGQDGGGGTYGAGGLASACTGDTKYDGGDGYYTASGYSGGGGGSSAGTGANGNDATSATGATAPTGGGNGGNGGARYNDGADGSTPGGGGGGAGDDANPREPGEGGDGKMTITFTH